MPEYLAPGVYVEEVDTGSKPIEGVSTSTTGMIGVTERGPVSVPILLTSFADFRRWFGGFLNIGDFTDPGGRPHCYLPHAAEGYFTLGGKRLYLTRILDEQGAVRASFELHDRGDEQSAETVLLSSASELSGGLGDPVFILDPTSYAPPASPVVGGRVRLGDGSTAEYRHAIDPMDLVSNPPSIYLPLAFPLSRAHAGGVGVTIEDANLSPSVATLQVDADVAAGDPTLHVTGPVGSLVVGQAVEIGASPAAEYRFVTAFTPDPPPNSATHASIELDSPVLLAYPATPPTTVTVYTASPASPEQIHLDASGGDAVIYLDPTGGTFGVGTLVVVDSADPTAQEIRRVGDLHLLSPQVGAYDAYERFGIDVVTLIDDVTVTPKALTANSVPESTVIAFDNRQDLAVGDVVRIDTGSAIEYATIAQIPNPAPAGSDPGNVVLLHSLRLDHSTGTVVARQDPPVVNTAAPSGTIVLPVEEGASQLLVSDGTNYAAGDIIRITSTTGAVYYHVLSVLSDDVDAQPIELTDPDAPANHRPLFHNHEAGATVVQREPLLFVEALDPGAWGNRLRVSVEDEETGIVSRTQLATIITPSSIRLASAAGVEAGTVLELLDPDTGVPVGPLLKVGHVDRSADFTLTLDTPLSPAQQSAEAAAVNAGTHLRVRSREFSLTVRLLRQPDPAMPSRNDTVIDTEVFRHLSMDPRHSRYVHEVIGDTQGELRRYDRRPEGESWYVRVHDLVPSQGVRLGPEPLVDILPSGLQRTARHRLGNGDDSLTSLADATYIGANSTEPENRTGLHTLRNEENISLVACPGQTSPAIQGALIDHCEGLEYRFAVLDGERPPNDSILDVQTQRQQFDTRYAALYHPWLHIPNPFPTNLNQIEDYPVPPAGHILGIYANTDVTVGVHKAPANEVVRGIRGLRRVLTKGEHDILNPYPVNINVIRDFRRDNRGIRVWGARVITSDPDWKYVNVRRLMIFLKRSIDIGLQWATFEVNSEPLWARVRRSITNFLTVVWRNGALEGIDPEEAFFVKCDRTTMTQTDIDNGRLICVIGVAPVKPAEFVIIRIGLWTAHAED